MRAKATPATSYSDEVVVLASEDFDVLASQGGLKLLEGVQAKRSQYKRMGMFGPTCDDKEHLLLNRVARCVETAEGPQVGIEVDAHRSFEARERQHGS